jgi:hypothetical protein
MQVAGHPRGVYVCFALRSLPDSRHVSEQRSRQAVLPGCKANSPSAGPVEQIIASFRRLACHRINPTSCYMWLLSNINVQEPTIFCYFVKKQISARYAFALQFDLIYLFSHKEAILLKITWIG